MSTLTQRLPSVAVPDRLMALWRHPVIGPALRTVLAYVALFAGIKLFLRGPQSPPPGVMVQGMLLGLLYSLVAFGLILIYRANRIINFAQTEMGACAAVLAVLLIKLHHVPYLLAFLVAMAVALVSGFSVEFLVIRRFAKAPRLVLSVATIGVALIFAVIQFYIPDWMGAERLDPTPPKTPFSGLKFHIDPLTFDANSIVIVFAIIVVVAGMWAFFKFTNVGIGVRAAAENADRARLLGISTAMLSSVVWMLATLLSALGVFLRIPVIGLPIGADVGPFILLFGLSAAVIGKMDSFYISAAAAVWLGILDQCIYFYTRDGSVGSAFVLPVLLVAMLMQRSRISRGQDAGVATWSMAKEFRAVPPELVRVPEVEWGRLGGVVAVIAAIVALPFVAGFEQQVLASVIVIYGIVAVSLVILTGWAGQISLGQWGLAGVGSLMASAVGYKLGWDFWLTMLIAGLAGALASVLIGLPALRIQGLYLAVATLAFGIAVQVYLLSPSYFPSLLPVGVEQIPRPVLYGRITTDDPRRFYFLCLVFLVLAVLSARAMRRSRIGRVLIAARDNERGAASYGVSVRTARLTAFTISGFWAAIGGALFTYQAQTVNQGDFDPSISLLLLTIVVLGGVTSLPGAMLGTAFIGLLKYGGLSAAAQNLASGLGVLIILMVAPGGVAQAYYGARDALLRWVAQRHRIVVPSLVADTREDDTVDVDEAEALRKAATAPALSAGSPA